MRTLRDLGELGAIRALFSPASGSAGVVVGAGDDAAVLAPGPGRQLIATTDAFVEGVHYRPDLLSPSEIGARLAAANLSDIAAMGAEPRWALISIGARGDHPIDALVELEHAFGAALTTAGATIVGGNLAAVVGPEWLSVTLLGEVEAGRAWTRAGARAGDVVAVSGTPGFAAAGLSLAQAPESQAGVAQAAEMVAAWKAPRAEVALVRELAKTDAVRAAIDVSDGLAADLASLCAASGTGAELERAALPNAAALAAAARALGLEPDELAFGPSDDYALLVAIDPALRTECLQAAVRAGRPFHVIGRITAEPGRLVLLDSGPSQRDLPTLGYDHFARGTRA